MISAIYIIRCVENGKFYLGRTNNVDRREKEHRRQLSKGIHHNEHLQRCFDKHGEKSIRFDIAQMSMGIDVEQLEQKWLDQFVGDPLCINTSKSAWMPKSSDLPPEVRQRARDGASAFLKKLNQDSVFSAARNERSKSSMERNWKNHDFIQKHKARSASRMAVQNSNPEFLAKMRAGISLAHQNPEIVARRLAASSAAWSRAVIVTSVATGEEHHFPSSTKAAEALALSISALSQCCNGKQKTTSGYICRFA